MTTTPSEIPFDSNATAYSLNNAYWLAQAAKIAYQEKSTIQPAVAQLGLGNFAFLSKEDTEGYIAANDKIIVVAFRGTEPTHIQDLLADARLHKVQGPAGKFTADFCMPSSWSRMTRSTRSSGSATRITHSRCGVLATAWARRWPSSRWRIC